MSILAGTMAGNRRNRLPPLNALRAFEAAARHGSLGKAADELCVTSTAVSQQVKLLESHLGLKLFLRHGAQMVLTQEAIQYLPALSDAFDSIALATMRICDASDASSLSVSTFTHFAMAWLLPRLHKFNRVNPELNVSVVTSIRTLDFVRSGMDVAIRWGRSWPNLQAHYLFSIDLVPLCAPKLLRGKPKLRRPEDLFRHHILGIDGAVQDWNAWFDALGADASGLPSTLSFDSLAFALQAAAEGHGVVMARLPLAESYLRDGSLVAPFPVRVRSQSAYCLLYPKASESIRKIQLFRDWITAEIADSEYHISNEAARSSAHGKSRPLELPQSSPATKAR